MSKSLFNFFQLILVHIFFLITLGWYASYPKSSLMARGQIGHWTPLSFLTSCLVRSLKRKLKPLFRWMWNVSPRKWAGMHSKPWFAGSLFHPLQTIRRWKSVLSANSKSKRAFLEVKHLRCGDKKMWRKLKLECKKLELYKTSQVQHNILFLNAYLKPWALSFQISIL